LLVVGANNILVRRPSDEVNAIQKASKTYEASNSSIEIPQETVLQPNSYFTRRIAVTGLFSRLGATSYPGPTSPIASNDYYDTGHGTGETFN
jgi:hypothetical protein